MNKEHELILRKACAAAFVVIAVGGLLILYFINPSRTHLVPCPFHLLTGLDCPGCGMTRAMHSLLHLDLRAAFFFNPFVFAVAPFLAFVWICLFRRILCGRPTLSTIYVPPAAAFTVIAVIVAFWILRNIPVYPFFLFKV